MPRRSADPSSLPVSPVRVFVLVLFLVFSAEGAIMLCLPRLPDTWHGTVLASLLDASTLTLIVAPAIWLLAVRPLRRLFEARGSLLQRLFESQEQERAHLARDLHDGVGQNLTALLVGLRTIEEARDLETASARARKLREIAATAHGEVRSLARGLRPMLLEELGLVAAVERLCEDFERSHGPKVSVRYDPTKLGRLDAAQETALYRIAQEALANVARHASASEIEVQLDQGDEWTIFSIRDNGRGFAPDSDESATRRGDGFGLGSMRERARMLGGDLGVRTSPGEGTTVAVRVPRQRPS